MRKMASSGHTSWQKPQKMHRSMLISNSLGAFSTLPASGDPAGPGGVMRMALGGHTNSHNWQETHFVRFSWSFTRYGAPRYPGGTAHVSSGYCIVSFLLKK